MKCVVVFNDNSVRTFEGYWKNILKDIDAYCDSHNLVTIDASWTE